VCRSYWSLIDVCPNFSSHIEDAEAVGLQKMAVLTAAVILKMQKLLIFKTADLSSAVMLKIQKLLVLFAVFWHHLL
jgi:hypothetical protein